MADEEGAEGGPDWPPGEGAVRAIRLADERPALIRPLRPEDDRFYPAFASAVTEEDHWMRFLTVGGGFRPEQVRRLTHFDREDARAYIALDPAEAEMLGVSRIHRVDGREGEFAVIVRSDLKGLGLGHALMEEVLLGAKALRLASVWGLVLRENWMMLALCREFGMVAERGDDPTLVTVRLTFP
ncbi:MAG: GCN5-related N-acetyltransferase [Enterovirga sp.]|nr:GCN5-related N-acetyltransferase [Enterovirga sp.]